MGNLPAKVAILAMSNNPALENCKNLLSTDFGLLAGCPEECLGLAVTAIGSPDFVEGSPFNRTGRGICVDGPVGR